MHLISGRQCRMARALLNWRIVDLHQVSKIGISTIRRIETFDNVPSVRIENIDAIRQTFIDSGKIHFIGMTGVNLRSSETGVAPPT